MASFRETIITNKGLALIAKMIAGTASAVTFSKFSVSETDLSATSEATIQAMTAISSPWGSVNVASVTPLGATDVMVSATINNTNLTSVGKYLRTIGLFANDPTEGEILFSVTAALIPDWIPPYSGTAGTLTSILLIVNAKVQRVEAVSTVVNPATFATVAQIDDIWDHISGQESGAIILNEDLTATQLTDSMSAPASVTVEGQLPITNLVRNGDLSENIDEWICYGGDSLVVIGDYIRATLDSSSKAIGQTFVINEGDVYYVSLIAKAGTSQDNFSFIQAKVGGLSNLYSNVVVRTTDTPLSMLMFGIADRDFIGLRNVGVSQNLFVKKSSFKVINLTAIFGAGNEPTVSQMDAMIQAYIDGTQVAERGAVLARGKNLFDKNASITVGYRLVETTGEITSSTATQITTGFFRIKQSTNYFLTTFTRICYYDKNKTFIAGFATSATTSPANSYYARASGDGANIAIMQIEQGATATPYEPFTSSEISYTVRDGIVKLPNGVKDELRQVQGRWQFVKRVMTYALKADDITALTAGTNIDLIRIPKANLVNAVVSPSAFGWVTLPNFINKSYGAAWDVPESSGIVTNVISPTYVDLLVPHLLYADLATAKAALTGTPIRYEVAVPIIIDQDDFSANGIVIEGLLSTENNITNLMLTDYNILAPVTINYAVDIPQALENIKDSAVDLQAQINETSKIMDVAEIPEAVYGAHWGKVEAPGLNRINSAKALVANVGYAGAAAFNEFDMTALFADIKEVTDSYGNVFVRIPKIYLKKQDETDFKTWYASRKPIPGGYLPWCFWDFEKQRELPYIDIGKYKASLSADGTKLESKTGAFPLINKTIVQMRTLAMANGPGYQQLDIHTVDLLQTLFYIAVATLDSQSISKGFTKGNYTATHTITHSTEEQVYLYTTTAYGALYEIGQYISVGTTLGGNEVMANRKITNIETVDIGGTNYSKITFDGTNVSTDIGNILYNVGWKNGFNDAAKATIANLRATNDGKGPFSFFGIESLYGDIWQFVDGVNINERQAWVCKDARKYASNLFANPYEKLSYENGAADGYVVSMGYDVNLPFANFPTAIGGAEDKYYTDYYYQATGQRIAHVGGSWNDGSNAGLSCWHLRNSSSSTRINLGGRLLKKPL